MANESPRVKSELPLPPIYHSYGDYKNLKQNHGFDSSQFGKLKYESIEEKVQNLLIRKF